jgi:hypothetical protein
MYSLAMLIEIKSALELRIAQIGAQPMPAEPSVVQAALALTDVLIGNHLFGSVSAAASADTLDTGPATES